MSGAKTVRLIAAARQLYDGRLLHNGDEFYTTEAEAKDLCALAFARRAPVAQLLKPRIASVPIETTAVEPEQEQEAPAQEEKQDSEPVIEEPAKVRRIGRYARRDLRAKT